MFSAWLNFSRLCFWRAVVKFHLRGFLLCYCIPNHSQLAKKKKKKRKRKRKKKKKKKEKKSNQKRLWIYISLTMKTLEFSGCKLIHWLILLPRYIFLGAQQAKLKKVCPVFFCKLVFHTTLSLCHPDSTMILVLG